MSDAGSAARVSHDPEARETPREAEDDGTWHVHLMSAPGGYRVALWRRVAGSLGTYEYVDGRGLVVRPPRFTSLFTFSVTEDELASMMVGRLRAALALGGIPADDKARLG